MLLLKKIALFILVLGYGASLFSLAMPFAVRDNIFVSPDEHATWTFAERITQTGVARVSEVRNFSLNGFLHPRSTVTVGEYIVPAGFLGITYLAGFFFLLSPVLAASTGPILCALGLIAFYNLLRFFGSSREFAGWSVVALAIHPAWWLYSMRSLMPNVPFVSLVLLAGWIAVIAWKKQEPLRRWMLWLCSGCLFGSALAIRPSEWIWMFGGLCAGAFLFAATYNKTVRSVLQERKKEIMGVIVGVGLVGSFALILQSQVYGSALVTGYTVDQPVWEVGSVFKEDISVAWYEKVFAILFPFGIHERATLTNVWRYIIALYPWMTVVGVVGVCLFMKDKRRQRKEKKDLFSFLFYFFSFTSLAYLLILYGSWVFFDNPDPSVISLGNSHTRYWLPIFVALAPAVAYVLQSGRALLFSWSMGERTKKLARIFPVIVLVLMSFCSAHLVFLGDDGVLHTRTALATFAEKRTAILEATPSDAIIIVDRADKYLWPHRAVVVPLRSEATYAKIPELLNAAPLYYFSITLPEEDLAYLNEVTLAQTNITFAPIITINEETLYEVTRE